MLPDGGNFPNSSFQRQSQASLKFISFLEGCSKARAKGAKSTIAMFPHGSQAQRLFFGPKMGIYALQNKHK